MSSNNIKNIWKSNKLKDICTYISRGITPKYTESINNSILVLNQRCIREGKIVYENARRHDLDIRKVKVDKYLRDYDILINSTGVGTLGRVSQIGKIKEITTTDSHVTIVRANEELIDNKYLGYAIKNKQKVIEAMAEGSTGQTELSRKRLGEELTIKFPYKKDEQKAIANILSTLDKKIEVNNQINKTLENMAQAIFKQWFIDFEFPDEDGQPYKSSGGEMVESELGMIPASWGVIYISDVCDVCSSKRIFAKDYVKDGIPFYRSKEIILKSKGETVKDKLYISREKFNELKSKFPVPSEGDILLTSVGSLGIPYLVSKEEFYFKDGNLTWFRNFNVFSYREYLYLWLKSETGKRKLDELTIGSTQKALTISVLKKIKIIRIDIETLSKFNILAKSLLNEIKENVNENNKLKMIRDSILPKLMSGEIRIKI